MIKNRRILAVCLTALLAVLVIAVLEMSGIRGMEDTEFLKKNQQNTASEAADRQLAQADSSASGSSEEVPSDGVIDNAADTTKEAGGSAGKSGKYEKITVKGKVETYGGTVVVGNAGYELYNFVQSTAKTYISVINKVAAGLKNNATVYDMVVPTSVGITLPDNKTDKINSSDQKQAIRYISNHLSDNVQTIDLYDMMMSHRKEYIYYRTDHHWTGRGAYYAYRQFMEEKGVEPHELSEYKQDDFGAFLGSFYTDSNGSSQLKTDRARVWYPVDNKKISMEYTNTSGSTCKSSVICDAHQYSKSLKYCAFIGGDNPFTKIKNKNIKDGSSCVVVKESFGNAMVPYLADHYETVYVIDYRYWQGSLTDFVKKKKVKEVLFINNISMTRNTYLIGKLAQIQ